jgi:zinc-binding alcohol dehydrogenase family protein
MKAVALTRYLPISDPDSLVDVVLDDPVPTGRDLLVRVEAVSVNPVDTKQRAPSAKVEAKPRVLGYDAAGVVAAVGPECTLFKPGDAVYYAGDVTRQGSNSELQLVDERIVGRKPKSLGFVEAAAIPLTAITAWECYVDRMKIDWQGRDKGASLLVIGGAGGVGSIGIQIAKQFGLRVIATASRPETIAWVKELGADHVVDHRKPLRPQIEALGMQYVDYIANYADTDTYWEQMGDLVRPQGAVALIVGQKQPLSPDVLRGKSASVCYEFMFTRPRFKTPDMIEQHRLLCTIADWIDAGRIRGTMKEALTPINAANLRAAHARLESGKTIGKLVVHGWK